MTRSKRKKLLYIIGSVVLLLIILRLLLPSIVLKYANKQLQEMEGYHGGVGDIDIALYRGAYQLDRFYINKVDSATGEQTEFFSAEVIDLSIEWRALLNGKIVGELIFFSPKLVFTKDKAELGDVAKDTNDFRKVLKDFMPLKVNRFEVHNGSIHYVDATVDPAIDIFLENTYILAKNLKNTESRKELLPTPIELRADAYGGHLRLDMKMNALEQQPTFDLTAELERTDLTQLNEFFIAYGGFDVNKGTMGLYSEFAAKDGKFKGYVKPIIKDLRVLGPEDKDENLLQKAKEGVVDAVGTVFKNPRKKQLATKVPIEGDFSDPSANTLEAIWEVLKNAFIEALMPSVDNEINIESATTVEEDKPNLLQRIFGSGKKEEPEPPAEKKKPEGLYRYNTSTSRQN